MRASLAQAAPQVPDPGTFSGYDDLGIAAVLVFVLFYTLTLAIGAGYLFYRRVLVWGSTCEKLVQNESDRADGEKAGKEEAQSATRRLAEDFSDHLRVILQELKGRG